LMPGSGLPSPTSPRGSTRRGGTCEQEAQAVLQALSEQPRLLCGRPSRTHRIQASEVRRGTPRWAVRHRDAGMGVVARGVSMRTIYQWKTFKFSRESQAAPQQAKRIVVHRQGNPGATALGALQWGERENAFTIHRYIEDDVVYG